MRSLRLSSFLLLVFLSSCTSGSPTQPEISGRKIRIFYNNDNFAYLETCGCRVSPIGGMDRRWNAMKAYSDDSRIFLDAGNLLFKGSESSETLAPQWFEQAVGVVEAYNLLGADAVAAGENEFALGLDRFQQLAKMAKFPFLSANIYWRDSEKLFLRDSLILHRQGKKIGVFGLFGKSLRLPKELEARDTTVAARKMLQKLKGEGADMIIALSHQGYEADVKLAKAVPEINLIVGAHSQSLLQKPEEEGSTLIVQLSNQGQMLGMVEYEAASLPQTRTNFVVTELDADFNEGPPGLANPMKNLVAITNLRIQEANRALDQKLWDSFGEKVAGDAFQTYLGCKDCHERQAGFHEGKAHSAAFLTLLAKHKADNLDCLKCHSVGLDQPGGFEALADAFRDSSGQLVSLAKILEKTDKNFPHGTASYRDSPKLAQEDVRRWNTALKRAGVHKNFVGVQCENCHGVLPRHPFGSARPERVTINACLQCHTREQAPNWYAKDGKLLDSKAQDALASMRCPR